MTTVSSIHSTPLSEGRSAHRVTAIDALRGAIMVLMLVDHVREYFYLHHQVSDPMLVGTTPPELFFTRLTSHFCAPLFVFLSGLSACLYGDMPGRDRQSVSSYLASRGLLLVVLELTVINFAWSFDLSPHILYLQVIWVIGLSMLALAGLLWLPRKAQWVLAIVLIAGHNLLDPIQFSQGESGFTLWAVLHDRSLIDLGGGVHARTSYPLLPWIGVILLGYLMGRLYGRGSDAGARVRVLFTSGCAALIGFVMLRTINRYGDAPWVHGADALETVMSYLNLTKYPPSLLFLLLTLGTGWLVLALADRRTMWPPLVTIGRVPLFFYVLHLYALHVLYLVLAGIYGHNQGERYGVDAVWQLGLVAVPVLLFLYWPCRWFAGLKARSPARWLKYF